MKHAVKWLTVSLLLAGVMACWALLGPGPVAPSSLPQSDQVPVAPAVPTPTELSQADEEAIAKLNEAMDKVNSELVDMIKEIEAIATTDKTSIVPEIG